MVQGGARLMDWALLLLVVLAPLPGARALLTVLEREAPPVSLARRALVTLTLWTLLQSVVSLFLGGVGYLDSTGLLVAEAAVACGGLAVLAAVRRRGRGQPAGAFAEWFRAASWGERVVAGLLCAEGLVLLWGQVTKPVTEYDSLAYHLPTIARWLQEARFVPFEQFARDLVASFPFTWEAIASVLVVPLRSDLFVTLPSLLAWVMLGLAVYALATRLGAAGDAAMATVFLLLNIPLLFDQTFAVRSDVALAAFFVAALELFWWFRSTRSPLVAALGAACAAIVCGIKVSGLAYALVLAAAFGALAFAPRTTSPETRPRKDGRAWLLAAGVLLLAVAVAGFWYMRNLAKFGNPLGCFEVRVAGTTLFAGDPVVSGEPGKTTLVHLFQVGNPSHWLILAKTIAYFLGIPFMLTAALAVPALGRRGRGTWLLAAVGVLTLALYLVTPRTGDAGDHGFQITTWIGQAYRYGFAFIAVLAVLAALGATRLRLTGERFLLLGLAGAAAALARPAFEWLMRGHGFKINSWAGLGTYVLAALLSSGALSALAWMAAGILKKLHHRWKVRPPWVPSLGRWRYAIACAGVVAALVVVAGPGWSLRERERQAAYGGIPECLERVAAPEEAVGYLYTHRAYQLFGTDLSRRTRFLGAAVPAPRDSPASHAETFEEWVASLRAQGVRLVAVGPLLPEWQGAREVSWLEDPHGSFMRVCGVDPLHEMVIFRLTR